MKRSLSILGLIIMVLSVKAQAMYVDGIRYNVIDTVAKTCEVLYETFVENNVTRNIYSSSYSGNVVIPENVEIFDGTYTIFAISEQGSSPYCMVKLVNRNQKHRIYLDGMSIIDDEEEFQWLYRAAELGYAPSYIPLGLRYQCGSGTEHSKEKAVFWYNKAKEAGIDTSMDLFDAPLARKIEQTIQ